MQKISIQQIVHYYNARVDNNEPVIVFLCLTDREGAIYRGFGPNAARLSVSLMYPGGITAHPVIDQFVEQGGDGYYGLHIKPGTGTIDRWLAGVYILGYQISNATHQCAGMVKLEFR
jgi:hypothetical protein